MGGRPLEKRYRHRLNISQHAMKRCVERFFEMTSPTTPISHRSSLGARCRRAIYRLHEGARKVIESEDEPGVRFVIVRRQCLVIRGNLVVTVYRAPHRRGFTKRWLHRKRKGKLKGIEEINRRLQLERKAS